MSMLADTCIPYCFSCGAIVDEMELEALNGYCDECYCYYIEKSKDPMCSDFNKAVNNLAPRGLLLSQNLDDFSTRLVEALESIIILLKGVKND